MDWSKVNYSSARAALNEVWRHIESQFAVFVEQAVVPIYYAVVEEAFDRGYIKPIAGVATLFPSHIFHSVVPTRSEQPRIAVPFDLGILATPPTVARPSLSYKWPARRWSYKLTAMQT